MPVSSPCAPAAGCSVTASMPAIAHSVLLQPVHHFQRALHRLVGLQRVDAGEAGQAGHVLVDLGVVLHGAGAERIEAAVDAVVAAATGA